ncbi:uncharacterized protein LOC127848057 [Dreissena polymorpha]|uniref:Uncharacterized protein n=1 Tax=Dreissena polymorpha TaxID=45954 RepID=A0A9D4S3R5_DREPO|nr:uncharacterized protein LOC127848057 [Dreissena polymorpha]KAH3888812.1 hypothetical protein DPMN_012850 [Dreissena polymorpha]
MLRRFSAIILGCKPLTLRLQSAVLRTQYNNYASKPDEIDVDETDSMVESDMPREASLAKCTIMGRLGRDPKVLTSKKGQDFVSLTIATNRGQATDWHNALAFPEKTMSYIVNNLKVGDRVLVMGTLSQRPEDRQYTVLIDSINKIQSRKKREVMEEEEI